MMVVISVITSLILLLANITSAIIIMIIIMIIMIMIIIIIIIIMIIIIMITIIIVTLFAMQWTRESALLRHPKFDRDVLARGGALWQRRRWNLW